MAKNTAGTKYSVQEVVNKVFDDGTMELVTNSLDGFNVVKAEPTAFAGGTTNARGDSGGTSDPKTIFTVTGDVLMGVFGVCTTSVVTGGGYISVGPTGNASLMLGSLVASLITQNTVYADTTPAVGKPIDTVNFYIVGNGVDIVEDTITADVTAGNIYYVALWKPLTPGSTVVSAV